MGGCCQPFSQNEQTQGKLEALVNNEKLNSVMTIQIKNTENTKKTEEDNLDQKTIIFPAISGKIALVIEQYYQDTSISRVDCNQLKAISTKNSIQQGNLQENMPHGYGKEIDNTQSTQQEGLQNKGKREGKGLLIDNKGNYYEGEFKDGIPEGKGTYVNVEGYRQQGNFHGFGQNCFNGTGKQISPEGSIQEGEFLNGKEHGTGKAKLANGNLVEGKFENGAILTGTMTFPDKSTYNGSFLNGKFEGNGLFTYSDGISYQKGSFAKGVKHGEGVTVKKDEYEIRGKWVNNMLEGKAQVNKNMEWQEVEFSNGKIIKTWKKDKKDGKLEEISLESFLKIANLQSSSIIKSNK